MKKLLFLATFIYFIIAPLTYHPDNKLVLSWAGTENGTVWNIWKYEQKHLQNNNNFNYPPLHFYLDKLQYWLALPIGGHGFHEWLSTQNASDPYQINLMRYTLAMKTGLIFFSLIVGYLLYLIAKQSLASEIQAKTVASLWLFNPIVLYSIPIMGQNDVMAIAFFLLGWYLLSRFKLLTSIIFGLSASIKTYPLIWLPFLLLTTSRLDVKQKFKIFIFSVGVYILTLLPFIVNPIFQKTVLGSDINSRFFIAQIGLGFSENIQIMPILLLLLIFGLYVKKNNNNNNLDINLQSLALMTVNLLLLGFSHFHPQWFTWIIPFWSLWLISQKRKNLIPNIFLSLITFGAWLLVIILFQDASLSYGLFIPINAALANLPILRDFLLLKNIKALDYNNYAHSWLAGMGMLALASVFTHRCEFTKHIFIKIQLSTIKIKKIFLFPLCLISSTLIIFSFVFLIFFLPKAPLSSPAPVIANYQLISEEIQTTFIANYNYLSRINLYFQNQDFKNQDQYLLTVKNNQNQLILKQNFSGFNTGFQNSLRFDFPSQSTSKGQEYVVKLTPLTTSDTNIEIAITQKDIPTSVAIMSYYDSPQNISYALTQSLNFFKKSFTQIPFLYAFLVLILFLSL